MKITKYEHACLDIREGNTRLLIDPGVFSHSLTDFSHVDALVITHIHPDHFDPDKVTAILKANPDVTVFTTEEVSKGVSDPRVTVPELEKQYQVESFQIEFFGKDHAVIIPAYPRAQNISVLVNETLYYPGDSFTPCPKPYQLFAVPVHAPWLKFSETAESITASTAPIIFPTHNGFLNDDGNDLISRLLTKHCEEVDKEYRFIKPGESIQT